ncbi:D-serine dehydratase [Bhargavaea cecembensis]|uniref:Probable D-serine dehydratase n=1 Tax=Bhargavaea cecembensis TaxID=394098 RepID=A0A161RDR0_9BACL|nr:D-serine ammonia-lyase [Bhargavaea cecembensis]KZE37782.1 D-serine dehydratase [Bhargavaea cecembensis]
MKIAGKTVDEWTGAHPVIREIIKAEEVFWENPIYGSVHEADTGLSISDMRDAEARLRRFAPYIAKVFPETEASGGIIESPLKEIPEMKKWLEQDSGVEIPGQLMLKCDSHLPISGSVKARGGIYEVLKHAEDLAIEHGLLNESDDYSVLAEPRFREFFSKYSITVGSTGNLGLSIGIMSAKMGFRVTVHMSSDAKEWKKTMLREKGVNVVEHPDDYSKAVEEGRRQSDEDPNDHFVDDENSKTLFFGYSVAALRLKGQLEDQGIEIGEKRPLFVYLPCGVGGGPGGIAFGLKQVFGDHVHCFFAEPTHAPCMLLGLVTGKHDEVSVQEFGLDNKTDADGLAVGRPSGFVGKVMERLLAGSFTVEDGKLYRLLAKMIELEDIRLEPSALAGLPGAVHVAKAGFNASVHPGMKDRMDQAVHIAWATGGGMVPEDVMESYIERGRE